MPPRTGRPTPRVVVVGGGIAGLAAAHALATSGPAAPEVVVLEGSPALGGALRVQEVAGLALDAGAESLLARRPEAVALARAVGLGADLVHPATSQASIWSRGRLRALPAGQVMGVPADLRALAASGVLTAVELARVPLDAWLPRTATDGDVAVGAYVARRLGRAVVDRLVEPLLGGVYAGRADRLSLAATVPALFAAARQERSLLAAAAAVRRSAPPAGTPVFAGLRGGVGRLPGAVARDLRTRGVDVRTRATVRGLRRTASGWSLVVGAVRDAEVVDADAVVLAVPARPASRLLDPVEGGAAALLSRVEAASVALVTFVLPAAGTGALPPGSGFLVPPVEGRYVKAATFASAKWDWVARATRDAGVVVVRASVGRLGEEDDLRHDDAEIAGRAFLDLAEVLPLGAAPLDARVTRWGGALPQPAVGHLDRMARVRAALERQPGLAVAGASYDGVGVPACIASGQTAAARVLRTLAERGEWRA